MKPDKENILRRYTHLPATIHMLQNEVVTLLNPTLWDDRNDSYFIGKYKQYRKLKSVLALCLTTQSETYHHWNVFAPNLDGICIEFKKDKLLEQLIPQGILANNVKYEKISDMKAMPPDVCELPFLKRYPYKDENEFRLIFSSQHEELTFKDFEIKLSCINRIYINPWMPINLANSVKVMLRALPTWNHSISLFRSTLIENENWKKTADDLWSSSEQ